MNRLHICRKVPLSRRADARPINLQITTVPYIRGDDPDGFNQHTGDVLSTVIEWQPGFVLLGKERLKSDTVAGLNLIYEVQETVFIAVLPNTLSQVSLGLVIGTAPPGAGTNEPRRTLVAIVSRRNHIYCPRRSCLCRTSTATVSIARVPPHCRGDASGTIRLYRGK